jgi:hypothetical protein
MDEMLLKDMTLASWAARVWDKELRGVPLQSQESSLAWCMRQHSDWRTFWNNLNNDETIHSPRATDILVHIYNDSAVKQQLDSNNPAEISELFRKMKAKGFLEMDALHTLSHVLQEQTGNVKAAGTGFDRQQYVERATGYVENVMAQPHLLGGLKVKIAVAGYYRRDERNIRR